MPSEPPLTGADLPDDPAALKARLSAAEAETADLSEEVARLKAIVAAFRRAMFGRRSEKLDADQLELALEEAVQELAEERAEAEADDAPLKARRAAAGGRTEAPCRRICPGSRPSSSRTAPTAPAAAAPCTGSARTSRIGST